MLRASSHQGHRTLVVVRRIVGWLGAVVFGALVVLWTILGIAPTWEEHLPEGLAGLNAAGEWWPILVLFAAAALAIVCLGPRPGARIPASTIVIAVFGISAVVVGIATYWPCSGDESPGWTPLRRTFDLFGGTLELPFGEVAGCPAELPLGLQAARLLALATIVILAGGVIALLFRSTLQLVQARTAREIVIATGLSSVTVGAIRRIRDSLTARRRLVIIDAGDEPASLAREIGALAIAVDAQDQVAVGKFLSGRTSQTIAGMYFLDHDPSANLRAMSEFLEALPSSRRQSEVPARIVVRIDNPWLADDWRRSHMAAYPGWLVDAISSYEIAARHVVARLNADAISTIVLMGSSPFELAVLQELSFDRRVGRALGRAERDVTVVLGGERADDVAVHFRRQLHRFGIEEAGIDLSVRSGKVADLMAEPATSALLLAPDSSHEQTDATFLATVHPDWTILCWDPTVRGVTTSPLIGSLSLVGPTLEPVDGQGLDVWEWFGRIMHQRYLDAWNNAEPTIGDPARGRWDEDLSPFTRESNVRSFATVVRTISLIGCTWATRLGEGESEVTQLSAAELDLLARAEHDSWVRHHEQNGWRYAATRDNRRLRHPLMVEWDQLSDDDKAKDANSVEATLSLLDLLGFTLVRQGATP